MEGLGNFSLKYLNICLTNENLFISPLSIYAALSMVYLGSENNTAKELKNALIGTGDINVQDFHNSVATLLQELNQASHSGANVLSIANGGFPDVQIKLNEKYINNLKSFYQAEMIQVNYQDKSAACKTINSWVEDKTHNKIKDLVPIDAITPFTRLVLANAVYFKCAFKDQFEEQLTKEEDFHLSPSKKVKKKLMSRGGDYLYAEDNTFGIRLLSIPFADYRYRLVIGLPTKRFGIDECVKKITGASLLKMLDNLEDVTVNQLKLPRFKLETNMELKQSLGKMGIVDLFTDSADLSGISDNGKLCVSDVFHKTFLDVNENGVEAAAATAMMMMLTSCPMTIEKKRIDFIVDEPFLFLIYNWRTKSVAFVGRINNP